MNYVGDIGVKLEFTINIGLSEIEKALLYVLKPDGRKEVWECEKGEGVIFYVTKEGDFDVAGTYQLQLYIETPTFKGRGSINKLDVAKGV
jgi:hypothetical protein